MSTSKSNSLIQKLENVLETNSGTIKECVINEALSSNYENPENFFKDLLQHGCISGMISSLIYYSDTEAFFDNHYEEIIAIKAEFEESTGTSLEIPYQIKNYLAWFSFEQVAYQLVSELGIEI